MSKAIGPEVEYECPYDCEEGGCPGHTIREIYDRSSDIYTFEIDGKSVYYFNDNLFVALLKAHELAKGL